MSGTSYFDETFDTEPTEDFKDTPVTFEEETLLTKGYFTSTVKLGNNEVVIRTLKIGEELEAALLAHKYAETIEAGRALATALVAAAVVTVNGKPLIREPLGRADETLEARFNYIAHNWYWLTVKNIHEEYNILLDQALSSFSKIKKG
jgi:hypothetical protein